MTPRGPPAAKGVAAAIARGADPGDDSAKIRVEENRDMIRGILAGVFALLIGAIALAADIDDTRLRAAATYPASRLTYGRDYGNQPFSPLAGINASHVTRLAAAQ